jgi:glycosyltransferase involved in cell wall biosynthesis
MVPYDEMPAIYGQASALVLASLPSAVTLTPSRPPVLFWEEQFGLVLAEAMAAGLPILASDSGAIPEVLDGQAETFAAGDWLGLARLLAAGPLSEPGKRRDYPQALLERHSLERAAEQLTETYDRLAQR